MEVVSSTIIWLADQETEIENAFNPRGLNLAPPSSFKKSQIDSTKFKQNVKSFLNESKEFQEFKIKLKKINKIF